MATIIDGKTVSASVKQRVAEECKSLYEKFGKRGWQCEICRNFNFEARVKCNRCGSSMKPKIIKKKPKQIDKDKKH